MGKRGRGLGLTIVYSIIKKHHGYVYVDSDPERQTVFHIYLPAAQKKSAAPEKVETPKSFSKGNILIMDDEAIVIEVASQMLRRLGYDVTLAKDGMEVIDIYERAIISGKAFDAVILDLHIDGGIGGSFAMKKLLQMDPDVKGIVSSGYANDPEMTDFERYGFCGIVEKPYSMHELSNILNKLIDQNKTIKISRQEWLERRSVME
jgi:CheY-like chemotaxis protein